MFDRIKYYYRNFQLMCKYPFLVKVSPRMGFYYNSPLKERLKKGGLIEFVYALNHNWYDSVPTGWQKAFFKDFLEELKITVSNKPFTIYYIGVKNGKLNISHSKTTKDVYDLVNFYQNLSSCYCMNCGEVAQYSVYDNPYCTKCRPKNLNYKILPIEGKTVIEWEEGDKPSEKGEYIVTTTDNKIGIDYYDKKWKNFYNVKAYCKCSKLTPYKKYYE